MLTAHRLPRLSLAIAALVLTAAAQIPKPPETKRGDAVETLHGVAIADPYRWLEDQDAPDTRAWIEAQNRQTAAVLDPLPGKARVQGRLTELLKIDTVSKPYVAEGRYFFTKRRADQDLSVLYMRKGAGGADEVLVDPHALSPDHTMSVDFEDISRDGRLIAYGVRVGGQDEVSVRLLDTDTRKELTDTLPTARYSSIGISADNKTIYYSRQTREGPRVFVHAIGGDPASDQEIFGSGYGPEKIVGLDLSNTRRYLVIYVLHGAAAEKIELYAQDLQKGTPIATIVNDLDATFDGSVAGDRLFLRTNWNAPNQRVIVVNLLEPAREKWRELVPEGKQPIEEVVAAGGNVFVSYLENVQPRVRIVTPDGARAGEISFPTIGALDGIRGAWSSDEVFFGFSSFALPPTIYRYRVSTGRQEVWARLNVPIKSEGVEVKQVWYTSKDGTRVPMFLGYRKGLELDGRSPALLRGYGGFNLAQLPAYSARAAFWIENGGVFALANLRGGSEFGEAWHRAGMLENKQNVFDDFISAAEWLIANKYTSSVKLAITGGSNGGLLVGAAMTERPELYRAVVCTYPLLDMIRYHRFLVAGYWVPEYGSSEDPAQFKTLYAYSPYHRVKKGERYPAVLFITGDGDTRVAPLHARKMAALLQASTGSERPILLQYDVKAGHSGGMPVSKTIQDLTDEMRFLFWQLGSG
ncbi:MAG: S9 family peptidase [Acidobacteria bacterium]|nr:S9 family peptidase [Acidobacteriota bacterium]